MGRDIEVYKLDVTYKSRGGLKTLTGFVLDGARYMPLDGDTKGNYGRFVDAVVDKYQRGDSLVNVTESSTTDVHRKVEFRRGLWEGEMRTLNLGIWKKLNAE